MYKKANRFMIGSRKGWGYSERSKASEPKTATKVRKKTLAIAREYQKILAKKKAHELRVSKEQQRAIAEKEARAVLREAIIASSNERKRSRLEAESKKVGTSKVEQQATNKCGAPKKEINVVRKRNGRLTKLRNGLVEAKTKPATDIVKALIDYKFVPSRKHLQIEPHWAGRHPKQAIDRAKASLERYAKSQYDEIRIYSKRYMGRVYFHVSGTQQMIDWQPTKAPPRNSHGGEVRARGIDSNARRGLTFKK